jgi:CheY-like chemotaxis protein
MAQALRAFRVLVIDDEAPVRRFVARVLEQPGYDVHMAADAAQALTLAETAGPFDILVTDLAMPDIQGDELARQLRARSPDLKILYLTGFCDRLFEARASLWEDEAFLEKPVSVQGLLEAVALLLVGSIPAPRPPRVRAPEARVRFADALVDLETLSATGARLQASAASSVGSSWPFSLECSTETLELIGRVVSCEPVPVDQITQQGYRIAVAFVDVPVLTSRALERICAQSTRGTAAP